MYRREEINTGYLFETKVENLFINEYMPDAPSDYVKVYLLALMYADLGRDIGNADIAEILRMDEAQIKKAWKYWEDTGAVESDGDNIVFVSMREKLYGVCARTEGSKERGTGREETVKAGSTSDDAAERKELFTRVEMMTGSTLNYKDIDEINSWIDEFGSSFETILQAYRYCSERGRTNIRYVGRIVMDWTDRGLDTAQAVAEYLGENDQRHHTYRRIMRALGFTRNPTERETQLMDDWLDELDCSVEEILKACEKTSGIPNPNFNYLNAVIEGSRKGSAKSTGISRAKVFAYYDSIRAEEERAAEARKNEVYAAVPKIRDIDENMLNLNSELLSCAVGGSRRKAEDIRAEMNSLLRQKDALLAENDIPVDYMNVRRRCNICGDTGQTEDGSLCSCFIRTAEEAAAAG